MYLLNDTPSWWGQTNTMYTRFRACSVESWLYLSNSLNMKCSVKWTLTMIPIVLLYLAQGLQFSKCIGSWARGVLRLPFVLFSNHPANIMGLHNRTFSRSRVDVQYGCVRYLLVGCSRWTSVGYSIWQDACLQAAGRDYTRDRYYRYLQQQSSIYSNNIFYMSPLI